MSSADTQKQDFTPRGCLLLIVLIAILSAYALLIGIADAIIPDLSPRPTPIQFTYMFEWKSALVTLISVSKHGSPIENIHLEDLPDKEYQGLGTRFLSNDPRYTCVNNTTPNVYTAQKSFPWTQIPDEAVYLIHLVCPNGTDDTWKFLAPAPPNGHYYYRATWLGRQVTLTLAPLPHVTIQVTGEEVENFETDDPQRACFNSMLLNTYRVSDFPTGQYLVFDRCTSLALPESWTFTS